MLIKKVYIYTYTKFKGTVRPKLKIFIIHSIVMKICTYMWNQKVNGATCVNFFSIFFI